ncbi:MAG: gliding motility-associated-like protein [Polaribacter sp.]|jgi:gliding motility-associated-like protein
MRLLIFFFLFFTIAIQAQTPVLTASQEVTTAGGTATVFVTVDSFENAVSLQFTLSWDSDILSYESTGDYGLTNLSGFNFGETQIANGLLTFVWFDGQVGGVTLADGSTVFSVTFNAIGELGEMSDVLFVNSPTPIQIGVIDGVDINEVPGFFVDGQVQIISNEVILQNEIIPIDCFGAATGSINIDIAGGLSPYEYNWTGPNNFTSIGSDLSDLLAGEYSLTVIDQLGNTTSETFTVPQATAIQIEELLISASNCNQPTGSITLSVSGGMPDYSYDYGNGFVSQSSQMNLAAGSFTLLIQDEANCQINTLIEIIEANSPSVDLGEDSSFCSGESLLLSAGIDNTLTYEWQLNGSTLPATMAELMITDTGSYVVFGTNAEGCSASDSIQVSEALSPSINLGEDSSFCTNGSILLDATTGLSYEWFLNDNLLSQTTATLNVNEAGTYILIGTNASNCTNRDTVIVNQIALPTLSVSPDTILCIGSSTLLTALSDAVNFEWFLNGNLLADMDNQLLTDQTGSYLVEVSDDDGCLNSAEIIVNPAQEAQADLGDDFAICSAIETILIVPSGALTYQWSFDEMLLNAATAKLAILETGIYSITVTSTQGCMASDTIQINEATAVEIDLGQDVEVCPTILTRILVDSSFVTYEWSFEGAPFGENDAEIEVSEQGVYTVVASDNNGCIATDSILVTVFNVSTTAGPDTTIEAGSPVQLFATGGLSYEWLGDSELSCYDCPDPIAMPSETTTYELSIITEEGCISEEMFRVNISEERELLVDLVNFISPNGDGKNDVLFFDGLDNYPSSKFSIFNRWGDLLFSKFNYQGDGIYWDATFKGKPLPAGIYYYILDLDQVIAPIKSSLTIVRK